MTFCLLSVSYTYMSQPKNWFFAISLLVLLTALTVPALGNVRLAFDSTELDFGKVVLSNARELVLEVWDTAAVPIEIEQLSVAGLDPGDFSVVSPTQFAIVLSPNHKDTQQIIVAFSPQEVGSRSAELIVETSDGNVIIPLSGSGTGGPVLSWAVPNIDFGTIAPGGELDTTIELYSTGMDTAIVDDIIVASSDTSFAAQFASSAGMPPIILAPGDSVAIQVVFHGLSDTGLKNAQLTTFGNLLSGPICDLFGDDEFGSYTIRPSPLFDVGAMYAGQVLDTTVELINTGDVSLVFNYLSLSTSGEDFTLLNPPQYPFTLSAGDTLLLDVQVNPGIRTPHRSLLQVLSPQADTTYQTDTLAVSVHPAPITAPVLQSLSYFCAIPTPIADTVPISNAGPETVVVTSIASNDSSIALRSDVSFPDTISSGITQPMIVYFTPSGAVTHTLVLEMLGGDQVMLTDTLTVQPVATEAVASITASAVSGTTEQMVEVSAVNGLTAYDLDSIIIHVDVQDSNVVSIDPSTIALASGISNVTISSMKQEPGGYAVTVTSTAPIIVPAGGSILQMDLNRYVSNTDSTGVIASIGTPELSTCLHWTADTLLLNGPTTCGSAELRNFLTGTPMNMVAVLRNDPVTGQNAELSVTTSQVSDTRYEVINALGEIGSQGILHLVPGTNAYKVSTSGMPTGVYTIQLIPEIGIATALRFVKVD